MLTRLLLFLALGGSLCKPVAAASLPDLHGVLRAVPAAQARATVLLFIAHDCPIANGYAPEIQRLATRYGARSITFYLVYVESDLSVTGARQHEAAYGYHIPALRDTRHILVRMTGATVTPEAVVLAPHGHVLYRGRIDDKYVTLGQPRFHIDRHDLRDALDAVIQGRPVPTPNPPAVGCFIPPLD